MRNSVKRSNIRRCITIALERLPVFSKISLSKLELSCYFCCCCFFLRQDSFVQSWLPLNSRRSSCLCLPYAMVKGVCHHQSGIIISANICKYHNFKNNSEGDNICMLDYIKALKTMAVTVFNLNAHPEQQRNGSPSVYFYTILKPGLFSFFYFSKYYLYKRNKPNIFSICYIHGYNAKIFTIFTNKQSMNIITNFLLWYCITQS